MIDDSDSVFDKRSLVDIVEGVTDPETPDPLSPEWHDFVMSKFADNELIEINDKKYPNCYGLRRVARLLMGEIIVSRPVEVINVQSPTPRTVVRYEVTIETDSGQLVTIGDMAGVSALNTDDLFLGYPDETAATRAEGRCLRKLLMLNCVAAEELTRNRDVAKAVREVMKTSPTDGSYREEDPISDAQIRLLTNKCRELNIDVLKYINIGEKNYDKLESVSKKTAINMIKLLNDYQNNSKSIPVEILKESSE